MWKLMIADDEPRIRRGLRNVLPWEQMGVRIVGEAEDGQAALDLAVKLQPNIMFVDICMPFLDGLELIERLHGQLQRCVIIVISGHDEFNYAQKAIKLHVFDYLLKPVQKQKLEETVLRSIARLEAERTTQERSKWVDLQLRSNGAVLRDAFLVKWVEGKLKEDDIRRNLRQFQLGFSGPIGMMVFRVLQSLDTGKASRIWDRDLLEFAAQNIAEELLKHEPDNVIFNDGKGHLVVIGGMGGVAEWAALADKIPRKIESLLEKLVVLERDELPERLAGAADLYNELVERLKQRGSLSPIIVLARRLIDQSCGNPNLTLQEVADSVRVSPTYLSKQLKKELGVSFIDYLTEVRIRKAIAMLNDPSIKVYEIAEQVGYSSQHYFSHAFKKVTGLPPLMYKKGLRS